ncbi:DNA-deoxyinosine glycosylase [Methylomonas sp. MO1]|uniref:DNA-deoxyinosine glycosylase n=1 Tax=unclassified Methylomonas TaxID=2608980 RepID=UPI0009DF323F|nr:MULTISPECIES: DNA-deoxyinosine glycosylase [unclassified Methylomonas]MDT4288759.1 DNA-deoxyinosine glycosylase [Methylomonas sp. MO1]
MNHITSFSAESSPDATVLILGSIPGKASLEAGQYYAHPRNHFWPIITELLAIDPASPYSARIESLKLAGIALWDVVKSCHRHNSSLDTKIDKNSIVTNDFPDFFLAHPSITHLFFNGLTAEKTFQKLVQPYISTDGLIYHRLPSTSPAHATMPFQKKLESWRILTRIIAKTSHSEK